jgi:hypothetical protein
MGWRDGLSGSGGCSGRDEGTPGPDGRGVSGGIGIAGAGSVGGGLG